MNCKLELGAWNSVFAVPSELVDKHLKLAGAVQLKVILWILRHAGENITTDDLAKSLNMQEADVRDSLSYWSETGLVTLDEGIIVPPAEQTKSESEPVILQDTTNPDDTVQIDEAEKTEIQSNTASRALSRPAKPDSMYLSRRMSEDEGIAYLMQSADEIFGRLTSVNDKATLLMIHETDGLPVEVIIMLMQYAAGIGKCNIRYIEKTAISWADDEINTLELAEKKIQRLTSGRNSAIKIQHIFGLEEHSPSEKETVLAEKWINQWNCSDSLLRKAYEICIDAKHKYISKYVDSILTRWHNSGITTPEQAEAENNRGKKKALTNYEATYDISEYENTSIIDQEV